MNFIDLFAGAGGLSEGFMKAGFNPIAHVEIDSHACKTLETRAIYHKLKKAKKEEIYYKYLRDEIDREELILQAKGKSLLNTVINLGIGKENNKTIFQKIDSLLKSKSVDLIIGGPPCQAYSLIGRARDKNNMKDDPRNFLYKEYGKFLKRYNPKVFVFENVLGLKTANGGKYFDDLKKHFESIGYNLDFSIQVASDFGVLQSRKRIILIGWKKELDFQYPDFKKVDLKDWKVKHLLSDLQSLKPGDDKKVLKYKSDTNSYLRKFDLRNGVDFVTQHVARSHNKRDLKIYKIAIKKWLDKNERLKYPDLPNNLKTHNNQKSFLDRFKVVDPNGNSHTMVAHISKDGHHYIYPDLDQVRSLSVREAARIQSFPDNFYFEGGRTAAFRQIGNAVPPLMAKAIAKKIREQI